MSYVGCHLSIEKGIIAAIQKAIECGGSALQIFVSPNQGTHPGKPISAEQSKEIKTILKNTGVFLVIHGKYVLNFASPSVSWYHDALISDIRKANQLGSEIGIVIHQGKNKPEFKLTVDQAIKNYVTHVQNALEATSDITNPIYLENSCQQGNEIGYTLEELAKIWHSFDPKYHHRLGLCLDTCHIFVSGALRFADEEEVDAFFEKFDKLIGIKNLKLIHFNDSKIPFNGHVDRHENLNEGFITNPTAVSTIKKIKNVVQEQRGSIDGLKRLVGWAKKYEIPLILETPRIKEIETPDKKTVEVEIPCEDEIAILNQWVDEAELPSRSPTITKKKLPSKNSQK